MWSSWLATARRASESGASLRSASVASSSSVSSLRKRAISWVAVVRALRHARCWGDSGRLASSPAVRLAASCAWPARVSVQTSIPFRLPRSSRSVAWSAAIRVRMWRAAAVRCGWRGGRGSSRWRRRNVVVRGGVLRARWRRGWSCRALRWRRCSCRFLLAWRRRELLSEGGILPDVGRVSDAPGACSLGATPGAVTAAPRHFSWMLRA